MTWLITYEAPKGFRINRYFDSVTTYRKNDDQEFISFYEDFNVWSVKSPVEDYDGWSSSHHNRGAPKTYKAFKRYLNNHPELKDYEVVAVNKYYTVFKTGETLRLHLSATWQE